MSAESRERVVSGEQVVDETERAITSLRPENFRDFVGQKRVVQPLLVALRAAKQRGEPLEHLILAGPPGLGKTTLAQLVRHELGADLTTTSGPALKRAGDLMGILSGLKRGDVLFIDEIHRLDATVEERLYPAMEDFFVDFTLDQGVHARTIPYRLQQFTLVGATTMAGLLSAPLRDRFGLTYRLDFYPPEELQQIVVRSAALLEAPLAEDAALEIARRSRGTPRIVNRLLRRVRDFAQVQGEPMLTVEIADQALTMEGIDSAGLDALDRQLLRVIMDTYEGGPVGIEALAATLNEQQSTLVEVVEPYLLQAGFLARTPTGRRATPKAIEHLGRAPQIGNRQSTLKF